MPAPEQFIRKTKKIEKRTWADLRSLWLRHQDAASSPGVAPVDELNDQISLKLATANAPGSQPYNADKPIDGLRTYVLKLGFYYLQKAAHNLASGRLAANNRFGAPSLYQAYETALIANKGICALLGIVDVTYFTEKNFFIVDVCSGRIKGTAKLGAEHFTRIINTEKSSIQHKESWALFKRLLWVTEFENTVRCTKLVELLQDVDDNEFARQRNNLQYHAAYWPFDEIRNSTVPEDFGKYQNEESIVTCLESIETDSFSFAVACACLNLGKELLKDLATNSQTFIPEYEAFEKWYTLGAA